MIAVVVDGIEASTGGEGIGRRTKHVKPCLLVAGLNPVGVDAVATAVMGFDPMADRGDPLFEDGDNTMRLGEELGVGTRELNRIEVIGPRISGVVFDYQKTGDIPKPTTAPRHDRPESRRG